MKSDMNFLLKICLTSIFQKDISELVNATAPHGVEPGWTYSDIRTRLYPTAVSLAFPDSELTISHFHQALSKLKPSPIMAG